MLRTWNIRLRDRDSQFAVASFGVTFIRLVVGLQIIAILINSLRDLKWVVSLGIIVIMAFDYLDGFLFSKSLLSANKQWRVRRRMVDSISDRLVIQMVCVPLLLVDHSFFWVYTAIVSREFVLSFYNVRCIKNGVLIYPGRVAKIACAFVGFTTVAYLTASTSVVLSSTIVMMVLSVLAGFEYRKKYRTARCESLNCLSNDFEVL